MGAVRFDQMIIVSAATIAASGATYFPIGSSLKHLWRMFRITNTTDQAMLFSFNGINDNLFVPSNGFVLYDCAANYAATSASQEFVMALGTQFLIKYLNSPSTGSVYIEGLYEQGE